MYLVLFVIVIVIMISAMFTFCPKLQDKHCKSTMTMTMTGKTRYMPLDFTNLVDFVNIPNLLDLPGFLELPWIPGTSQAILPFRNGCFTSHVFIRLNQQNSLVLMHTVKLRVLMRVYNMENSLFPKRSKLSFHRQSEKAFMCF